MVASSNHSAENCTRHAHKRQDCTMNPRDCHPDGASVCAWNSVLCRACDGRSTPLGLPQPDFICIERGQGRRVEGTMLHMNGCPGKKKTNRPRSKTQGDNERCIHRRMQQSQKRMPSERVFASAPKIALEVRPPRTVTDEASTWKLRQSVV